MAKTRHPSQRCCCKCLWRAAPLPPAPRLLHLAVNPPGCARSGARGKQLLLPAPCSGGQQAETATVEQGQALEPDSFRCLRPHVPLFPLSSGGRRRRRPPRRWTAPSGRQTRRRSGRPGRRPSASAWRTTIGWVLGCCTAGKRSRLTMLPRVACAPQADIEVLHSMTAIHTTLRHVPVCCVVGPGD